uniref:G protein-coupled receptor n=1 Tax=Caenorhabditis tropicalis TaxID=1561998 RepID=A0A1I7UH18_9PELO
MSFAANMYLYLAEGVVICVTNMTLLWCILSDGRNRKRREFLLVAAQSVTDIFYGVAFMLIANLRLGLFYENKSPLTIALFLTSLNALLLIGNESQIAIICIAANGAAHHFIYHIMLFFRIIANLASAVIYLIIILYLKKSQGGTLKDLSPQQLKMHRNAKITLGLVTTNSMILLLFPDILLFANPFNITKYYSTPLYSMTLSKTMINFMIYMIRYRELRNIILLKVIGCLPKKWAIPLAMRLRSTNEASNAPKGTFATRSSIGTDRMREGSVDQKRRASSIVAINKSRVLPTVPTDPYHLPPLRR